MSEISVDLESNVGNGRATDLAVGILGEALAFCKVFKMGPVGTSVEGGLLEKQLEKVLWVNGTWGSWHNPQMLLSHLLP